MKSKSVRISPILVIVLSIIGITLPTVSHAVLLEFRPEDQMVLFGEQATVDVFLSEPAGNIIGAYDFFVNYDPNILSIDDIVFGSGLGDSADVLQSAINNSTAGSVNASALSFLFDLTALQDGVSDLYLFSITFDTLDLGTSLLNFEANIAGIAGGFVGDELGFSILLDSVGSGRIDVIGAIAVSEPSPLLLAFLVGSLILVRSRQRLR